MKSKRKYTNFYENNFIILPTKKTIIGFCSLTKSLQIEEIRGRTPVMIDNQNCYGNSIMYNQNLNILLVGYQNRFLIQYQQITFFTWKIQKKYTNIGVGRIYSIDLLRDIAVLGGDRGKIAFINLRKRQVIGELIDTSIYYIYSLQFCEVSPKKIILVVGGHKNNYFNYRTDLFNVTKLFRQKMVKIISDSLFKFD